MSVGPSSGGSSGGGRGGGNGSRGGSRSEGSRVAGRSSGGVVRKLDRGRSSAVSSDAVAEEAGKDAATEASLLAVDAVAAAGGSIGGVGSGFAAAINKVMSRTIAGAVPASSSQHAAPLRARAPVMAKRHGAAEKLADAAAKARREEEKQRRARESARLAALVDPRAMDATLELRLRKLATRGGTFSRGSQGPPRRRGARLGSHGPNLRTWLH